jgi:hypothetical protein
VGFGRGKDAVRLTVIRLILPASQVQIKGGVAENGRQNHAHFGERVILETAFHFLALEDITPKEDHRGLWCGRLPSL